MKKRPGRLEETLARLAAIERNAYWLSSQSAPTHRTVPVPVWALIIKSKSPRTAVRAGRCYTLAMTRGGDAVAVVLASAILACSSGGAAGAHDAAFDGPVWATATGAACRDSGGHCITASACAVEIGGSDCGPGVACCRTLAPQVCLDAGAPPIRASTYDQSCQKASDCVAIGEGSVCAACLLSCPNAAINEDAKSQYLTDLEKAGRRPGADLCFCSFGPAARRACGAAGERAGRGIRMIPVPSDSCSPSALAEINRQFYEPLWAWSRLVAPERFNTWPLVRSLLATSPSRLEVAPGLNPRLPITGTRFVDMSEAAVAKLIAGGADATVGLVGHLPYADAAFDLIGAFDILEHVAPLHPARWTRFDELVGHGRRYRPEELLSRLSRKRWSVEQSGAYGMQPRSALLSNFAVWSFEHRRPRAIWWYSRMILPLGAFFQGKLVLRPGMIDAENVDEVLLVCRRTRVSQSS